MKKVKVDLDWTYGYQPAPHSSHVYYGPGRGILVPEPWARAMGFEIVDENPEPDSGRGMGEVEGAQAAEWYVGQLGFRPAAAEALVAAGFTSLDSLRAATSDELLAVPGVGKAYVRKIREALEEQEA